MVKAKLVLENGEEFSGEPFGHEISASGEVVFNTGMMGYPETLTDPSYTGQILVMTYPLIGNYGVPENKTEDIMDNHFESGKIHVKGLIVSEYSSNYSHWNAKKSLHEWLKEQKIPAITGIDTRKLTRTLRDKGAMLGKLIIDKEPELFDPNKENLASQVSIRQKKVYKRSSKKIVLIDCGVKNNIIRNFLKRDITVIQVPWDYDFTGLDFDGLFISNGPGDPTMYKSTIENIIKTIRMQKPTFGICLGNQLLALAIGAKTYKLKYGHRSQNQPCIMNNTKKCFITSQNHGFAVDDRNLPKDWEVFFSNVNDQTNEGIRHKTKPFFSVQFHPEACAGPTDTQFLFDEFIRGLSK